MIRVLKWSRDCRLALPVKRCELKEISKKTYAFCSLDRGKIVAHPEVTPFRVSR